MNRDADFGASFLGDILDWVARTYTPEEVFGAKEILWWLEMQDITDYVSEEQLMTWAEENGYTEG